MLFTQIIVLFLGAANVLAQDAVPGEILQRTKLIKVGNGTGTAFSVDYGGKVYLVTARHVVSGVPVTDLQVWHLDRWTSYHIVKTLFPASPAVDIAVLETDERIPTPYSIAIAGEGDRTTFGQQVWFLGYPFGDPTLASQFQELQIPFIKRGSMSAIDTRNANAVVLYIDGFNNPGFSGGPIVYWDFQKRQYKIVGVVMGYRPDKAKVLLNNIHVDTDILVNSGILIGYSAKHVVEAIEKDQKR